MQIPICIPEREGWFPPWRAGRCCQPAPSLPSLMSRRRDPGVPCLSPRRWLPAAVDQEEGVWVLATPGPTRQAVLWGSSVSPGLACASQKRDSHGGVGAAPFPAPGLPVSSCSRPAGPNPAPTPPSQPLTEPLLSGMAHTSPHGQSPLQTLPPHCTQPVSP